MKVLHIASGDLWAGAEFQLYTLLVEQRQISGNELAIILLNDGELAQRLRGVGLQIHVVDESQLSFLNSICLVRKIIRDFQPRIIHSHRQKESTLAAISGAYTHKIYYVRTIHGQSEKFAAEQGSLSSVKRARRILVETLEYLLLRFRHDAIISVTAALTQVLRDKFPPARIHTIANGINIAEINTNISRAAPAMSNDNEIKVGICGRLEPVKRLDVFLQTAQLLIKKGERHYTFHIFGSGKLEATLKQQAKELGLDEQIIFYGHVSDSQQRLSTLDILLLTSDHEGTPMVMLEAIAVATPLISHRVGEPAKLLDGFDSRYLADKNTPELFFEKISALDFATVSKDMIQLSERLKNNYSSIKNAQDTQAVYQRIAEKSHN